MKEKYIVCITPTKPLRGRLLNFMKKIDKNVSFPPHITLLEPAFILNNKEYKHLISSLRKITFTLKPFEINLGKTKQFGNCSALSIKNNILTFIHHAINNISLPRNKSIKPHKFYPHLTLTHNKLINVNKFVGNSFLCDNISILKQEKNKWVIKEQILFS